MKEDLFNFSFEYWPALLLAAVPALINLSIIIYVLIYVKKSSLSIVFLVFLFTLFMWRTEEITMRLCVTEEAARQWNHFFSIATSYIAAAGLHFILLLIDQKKWDKKYFHLLLLYIPSFVSSLLIVSDIASFTFEYTKGWGWVMSPGNLAGAASILLIGIQALLMVTFLSIHTWKIKKTNSHEYKRARIILIGLSIPAMIGIIYQIILPVFFQYTPVPIASSAVVFFSLSALIAITKYKFLEYSPRYHWESIVADMNEGILITDTGSIIQYVNNKFCQMTGYSREELMNKNYSLLFPPAEEKKQGKPLPVTQEKQEVHILKKTGETIVCEINKRPYADAGTIIGAISIYNDVTERKNAENALQEKIKEMDTFIYRASHDLRGPLASIAGLTALGKQEVKEPEAISYFNKIHESVARLDDILQELSKLARVTQARLEPTEVNLEKEIDDILKSLSHLPNFPHIRFIKEIMAPVVYCDKILLIIILQNLIINSINYFDEDKEGPFVRIRTEKFSYGVKLTVEDNGLGIPDALQEKVFEMFYRGTSVSKGSGLGLYIVRNAVQKLHGTVQLNSREKEGSLFTLVIPHAERSVQR